MMIRFTNWPNWFRQTVPDDKKRVRVLEGYSALGAQFPQTLADIALRNQLFADAQDATTLYDAGVAEGRRRAALEIFKLCNMDVNELFRRTQDNGAKS